MRIASNPSGSHSRGATEQLSTHQNIRDWSNIPSSLWKKGAPSFIQRSQHTEALGKSHTFAIYDEGELVAVMGVHKTTAEADAGELYFWIEPRVWKSGQARQYISEVLYFAFEHLKLECLATVVEERNTLCIQMLEAVGFRRKGRRRLHEGTSDGDTILFLEKLRELG